MDSRLEKSCKVFFDLLIALTVVLVVPFFFSPVSETLVLVSKERVLIYGLSFSLSFLLFGEFLGVREPNFQIGLAKSFLLPLLNAALATLTLLVVVWAVEYSFIGRFALGKILLSQLAQRQGLN